MLRNEIKNKIKRIIIVAIISMRPFMCIKAQHNIPHSHSIQHTLYIVELLMKPCSPLSKANHRIYYLEFYDWIINDTNTHSWNRGRPFFISRPTLRFRYFYRIFYVICFLSLCHQMTFDCNMVLFLIRKKLAHVRMIKSEKKSRH